MRRLAAILLGAMAFGSPRRLCAQEARDNSTEPLYAVEGQSLRITQARSSTVVDLGCEGRSVLRMGNKLLVACGSAGVVEFDLTDPLSPRRDGTMQVSGDASEIFVHDGVPWVEISHVDARPLRIGTASVTAEPPVGAEVLRRKVDVHWEAPRNEDRLEREQAPAADAGEEAPSIVAPPRRGSLWELSFVMSGFVAMGSLGAGELGSASVSYRFEPPVVLRAEVAPFGVAGPTATTSVPNLVSLGQTTNTSTTIGPHVVASAAAHLILGLDTQFVEVGVGAGGATVNQNPGGFTAGGAPAPTSSLSIVEEGRLGARDGLSASVESSAIAINQKFDLGYFVASFQIPISRTLMVIVRGGGGNVGFAYGDLGVRLLVHGNGGRGTFALTGLLGGAGIMEDVCGTTSAPRFTTVCNPATLVGPSLGGGVEWRL